MLGQGRTSGGGEEVVEELNLGHGEFTLGQANCQTLLPANEKNFSEVVDIGGQVPAED